MILSSGLKFKACQEQRRHIRTFRTVSCQQYIHLFPPPLSLVPSYHRISLHTIWMEAVKSAVLYFPFVRDSKQIKASQRRPWLQAVPCSTHKTQLLRGHVKKIPKAFGITTWLLIISRRGSSNIRSGGSLMPYKGGADKVFFYTTPQLLSSNTFFGSMHWEKWKHVSLFFILQIIPETLIIKEMQS